MLASLLALAAFSSTDALAAPTFLEVGDLVSNSWTGEEGDYTRVDDGDSACGCWARDGGDQALGNFGGTWYLLAQGDCDVSRFPSAAPITSTGTCDPTDLAEVSPRYDVEIEVIADQDVQVYVDTVPAWGTCGLRGGYYGSSGAWLNEAVFAEDGVAYEVFGLDLPPGVQIFGLDPHAYGYREVEVTVRSAADGSVLLRVDEGSYGQVCEGFVVPE